MKIQLIITADYASIDQATQKLNILGAFTRIHARTFPIRHQRMVLAVKIAAELGDSTETRLFKVVLVDSDGMELLQVSGPLKIGHESDGTRPDFIAVLELNDLEFPHPGHYEFKVYVDDQELGNTSIGLAEVSEHPET